VAVLWFACGVRVLGLEGGCRGGTTSAALLARYCTSRLWCQGVGPGKGSDGNSSKGACWCDVMQDCFGVSVLGLGGFRMHQRPGDALFYYGYVATLTGPWLAKHFFDSDLQESMRQVLGVCSLAVRLGVCGIGSIGRLWVAPCVGPSSNACRDSLGVQNPTLASTGMWCKCRKKRPKTKKSGGVVCGIVLCLRPSWRQRVCHMLEWGARVRNQLLWQLEVWGGKWRPLCGV
jgi:hypothetical protein